MKRKITTMFFGSIILFLLLVYSIHAEVVPLDLSGAGKLACLDVSCAGGSLAGGTYTTINVDTVLNGNTVINAGYAFWGEGLSIDSPNGMWGGIKWRTIGRTGYTGNWHLGYNNIHSNASDSSIYMYNNEAGNVMTWTQSGNVGIGTTAPEAKLDINGNVVISPQSAAWGEGIKFSMPNTTTWGGLRWSRNRPNYDGNFYIGYTALDATDDLVFGANNGGAQIDNILRLTKAGNVGIGTADPQGYKFYVNGTAYSWGGWQGSDINFKKEIRAIDDPVDKVLRLNGVSYEWKTDDYKDKNFPEGRHYGVIAQEIEKVLPEVVNTAPDGTKSVAYTEIIPVLIEAIKAQQKEINDLKELVNQLTSNK